MTIARDPSQYLNLMSHARSAAQAVIEQRPDMTEDDQARIASEFEAAAVRLYLVGRVAPVKTVHGLDLLGVADRHGLFVSGAGANIDVGDGWAQILDRLFTDLYSMGWDGRLDCIKEKVGTLRVYLGGEANAQMSQRILAAEVSSETVCEECGDEGRMRRPGRAWTLCDRCAEREGYRSG